MQFKALTFFVFTGHFIRMSSDRTTPLKDPWMGL